MVSVPPRFTFNSSYQCSPRHRNDILRSKGIIPEKPQDPEPLIQEALVEAERKAYENRLEDKDLDELDELEDEEDDEFLEQYRCASQQPIKSRMEYTNSIHPGENDSKSSQLSNKPVFITKYTRCKR